MPLGLANPPGILTPGRGPNGPGPFDFRRPVTTTKYAAAGSQIVNPNGIWGPLGPPADSLQKPIVWYIRSAGSNNNGGTSTSLTPDRTGTDGVANATATFTSATAAFTSADVGKGICISTGATARHCRIAAVGSATSITLDRTITLNASGQTWAIGGAWADWRAALADAAANNDTNSPLRPGDSLYIGGGTYRIVLAVGATWSPAFNGILNVIGDVSGQFTGDAGMVLMTAYVTNDKTAPSATMLVNLGGKSNLAFSNLFLVGGSGNASVIQGTTALSQNITFRDVAMLGALLGSKSLMNVTNTFLNQMGQPLNWLIDRCQIVNGQGGAVLTFTLTTGVGAADYNAFVLIQNSVIDGGSTAVLVSNSGTLAQKGGGVLVRNCMIRPAGSNALATQASQNSLIFPCFAYNNLIITGLNAALNAGTLGQIVEDYNLIYATTPRTNVNVGAHSISDGSYAALFHFGQERIWGGLQRMFGEPMAASPLLSFGNDGSQTLYDLANRPRPAGGGSGFPFPAAGALERGSTAAQGTSPAPPSGTYTWQNTGPWYQDFLLPVSNVATTVSISVQRDANYQAPPDAGNPALLILSNGTLDIPAQTIVDTGATGQWNTLTSAAFTPSGTGWVTVRIVSYDGTGVSVVGFADVVLT